MPWEVFDLMWRDYVEWYERNRVTAANEAKTISAAIEGLAPPCADVGAGHGIFTPQGCLAVEPSQGLGRVARSRGLPVVSGRAERLPIRHRSLSYILAAFTICFLDDVEGFLAESVRALRDDGRLVACIITRDSSWGELYEEMGRQGHPFYSVARFYTVQELLNMAERVGLKPEKLLASIRYEPQDQPVDEEPTDYTGREAFVCVRLKSAAKPKEHG